MTRCCCWYDVLLNHSKSKLLINAMKVHKHANNQIYWYTCTDRVYSRYKSNIYLINCIADAGWAVWTKVFWYWCQILSTCFTNKMLKQFIFHNNTIYLKAFTLHKLMSHTSNHQQSQAMQVCSRDRCMAGAVDKR